MKLTFLTHASIHYDKQFAVLERSIRKYHPDAEIIRVSDIPATNGKDYVAGLPKRRFMDLLHLLEDTSREAVVMIGADCVLFGKMEIIEDFIYSAGGGTVLLHPHIVRPASDIGNCYLTGVINGDFIVFKNRYSAKEVLNYLITQDLDVNQISDGYFYEQTYLTMLPFFFKNITINREVGYHAAYYNLQERKIAINSDSDKFTVNDKPLVSFHFSGFDIDNPTRFSRHEPNHVNTEAEAELLKWYYSELNK